jgi:hypothetical protein
MLYLLNSHTNSKHTICRGSESESVLGVARVVKWIREREREAQSANPVQLLCFLDIINNACNIVYFFKNTV